MTIGQSAQAEQTFSACDPLPADPLPSAVPLSTALAALVRLELRADLPQNLTLDDFSDALEAVLDGDAPERLLAMQALILDRAFTRLMRQAAAGGSPDLMLAAAALRSQGNYRRTAAALKKTKRETN